MSFILKALQKLEAEKNARHAAPVELENALLTPDTRSPVAPRRAARWLAVPLVFAAGVGLTFLVMHAKSSPPRTSQARAVPSAPVTPAVPPPLPRPEEPAQSAVPAAPQTVLNEHTSPPKKSQGKPPRESSPVRDAQAPLPSRDQGGSATPPLSLTVNGIALQDDPAESVAVVNGALVKTGMEVGGVQVERIFQDKVRFRGGGGTFEVPLAK